jgi:signal transduction histidine kinase
MGFRYRSLFVKLLVPIAGAVALLTIAVGLQGARLMRGALIERARVRVEALAAAERDEILIFARNGDHRNLQDLIEAVGAHPDIAAVRVLRPNGLVRAASHRSDVGATMPDHVRQGNPQGDYIEAVPGVVPQTGIVHAVRALANAPECTRCHQSDGPVIAVLDVDVAVNEHRTGVRAFGQLSSLLGVLYFFAAVGIAVPTLSYIVVRPLKRLIAALKRVEAGDLSTQVAATGTTEIDAAVDGFNGMVARLRHGRAAEQEAQRLQLERVEQLAAVGQLAAGLAHEFRNPLSSVRAVLEVVADEPGPRESRQILRDAASELDRLDQIVRDLLQYARPRAPTAAPFDLNALVGEVSEFTLSRAVSCGVTVRLEPAADLRPALGDADMVRQVLVNLLLNAQQAAPAAGAELTVTTGHDGRVAWCRVRDNGAGVPLDRAPAVFRPFVTTKPRGTGLGLSISRRIIELQGGQLTLDNPGEHGASFTFTLPLASDSAEPDTDVRPQDPHR